MPFYLMYQSPLSQFVSVTFSEADTNEFSSLDCDADLLLMIEEQKWR